MRTLRIFFTVLAIEQAGDIATTHYALSHGLGHEGNVLMQGATSLPAMLCIKALWLTGGYLFMRHALRRGLRQRYVWGPLLASVALCGAVVLHNLAVIRA